MGPSALRSRPAGRLRAITPRALLFAPTLAIAFPFATPLGRAFGIPFAFAFATALALGAISTASFRDFSSSPLLGYSVNSPSTCPFFSQGSLAPGIAVDLRDWYLLHAPWAVTPPVQVALGVQQGLFHPGNAGPQCLEWGSDLNRIGPDHF